MGQSLRHPTNMPLCITQPIIHGGNQLQIAPSPPRRRTTYPRVLSLGALNIRNGRGSRLAQAIWVVKIGSFNLMILTEVKTTNHNYFRFSMGYKVICLSMSMTAAGGKQEGVFFNKHITIFNWRQAVTLVNLLVRRSYHLTCP